MSETFYLFCDGSVKPQQKIGFGAYLLMSENEFVSGNYDTKVKTKRFEDTSSTKLELETFLWAIADTYKENTSFKIFTDCQMMYFYFLSVIHRCKWRGD